MRRSGGWSRTLLLSSVALLCLSGSSYGQDPSDMTTPEILAELSTIIETQQTQLTELTLELLRLRLIIERQEQALITASESSASLRAALSEQATYSLSLEGALTRRTVALTILAISLLVALVL